MVGEVLLASIARELSKKRCAKLSEFCQAAWPLVEPASPLVWSKHNDIICDHLESVSHGDIRNLGINVPPGCTKSLMVSVLWPAWEWAYVNPQTRWINVSTDGAITLRDARRMLNVLDSQWYRELYGDKVQMPLQHALGDFANMQGGWRFSTSVGGRMIGRHCDVAIIDDPIKPVDVTDVGLANCKAWWTETLPTRFGNLRTARRVMIMQRLHEEDLAGVAQREPDWTWVILPMRFEASRKCVTPFGSDWRTVDGEPLEPNRFPEHIIKEQERKLGSRGFAAQYQQRPAPAEGAIFKQAWFKHYKEPPARFDMYLQSWDCAFKDTDGSDYVCGQLWGVRGGEYFLLAQDWQHYDFPETCAAVERMTRQWPKAVTKLIEDKANGTAVIQTLRKKISGIIPVDPEGGKESRAKPVAPLLEAGNVWFPDPAIAPWVDDFELELTTFPMASHDDRVDAMTQALLYLHGKASNYAAAMRRKRMGLVT